MKSPGILLTLALSTLYLAATAMNAVLADTHSASQPVSYLLEYESGLTGYKAMDGGEAASWKQSNDTVGQIGGWRSYAREAYQANQAEASAKSDSKALAVGTDEILEDKNMDTDSAKSDNTEVATLVEKPETQLAERPDSLTPTISYQSVLSNYRLYDDNPPGDWRAANDRVGEIGGWRAYAKEAYEANKRNAQLEAESGKLQ